MKRIISFTLILMQLNWSMAMAADGSSVPAGVNPYLALNKASEELGKQIDQLQGKPFDPKIANQLLGLKKTWLEESNKALETSNDATLPQVIASRFGIMKSLLPYELSLQPMSQWNLAEISKRLSITVSRPRADAAFSVVALPASIAMVQVTEKDVVYSLQDVSILQSGIQVMLRNLNDQSYEAASRCVLGYSLAIKFSDAFLKSLDGSMKDLTSRVSAYGNRPFCMGETLPHFIQVNVRQNIYSARSALARMELVNLIPDAESILPPTFKAHLDTKKFRVGDSVLGLKDDWARLILTPELVVDRQADDASDVLSLAELKPVIDGLKKMDASAFGPTAKYLTATDPKLFASMQEIAKKYDGEIKVNNGELARRLRMGQMVYLKLAVANAAKGVSVDALDSKFGYVLARSIYNSLKTAISDFSAGMFPKGAAAGLFIFEEPIEEIIVRHAGNLKNNSEYRVWRAQFLEKILQAATAEKVFKMEFEGYKNTIKDAASDMNAMINPALVADDKLKYTPNLVIEMLSGEINKSSPRVQAWFDLVKNSGGYKDMIRTTSEVEAHIKKTIKDPNSCNITPISNTEKFKIFGELMWEEIRKSVVSPESGRLQAQSNQNVIDCARFVRLATFAGLRDQQEAPKDMAIVVTNLDKYWSEENRKTLLNFYRELLKIEFLNKYRLLDYASGQDATPLYSALNNSNASQVVLNAVQKTMQNIEEQMKQLTEAQGLAGLAPFIVKSSLLDAAYGGGTPLTTNEGVAPEMALAMMLTQTEPKELFKIKNFTDIRRSVPDEVGQMSAALKFHQIQKDKFKVLDRSVTEKWNTIYGRSIDSIWPLLGLALAKGMIAPILRPIVGTRTSYAVRAGIANYMAANRSLGLGYMSMVSLAFAGDAYYQDQITLPMVESERHKVIAMTYSSIDSHGPALLTPTETINGLAQLGVTEEDAKMRRLLGVAATLIGPLAPLLARMGKLPFSNWQKRIWERRNDRWERWHTENPGALKREIDWLAEVKSRRMERLISTSRNDLRVLGIDSRVSLNELTDVEFLQNAMHKAVTSQAVTKEQAFAAYRNIIKSLSEEFSGLSQSPDTMRGILSQIYSGGKIKPNMFLEIEREFERVILGIGL